MLYSRKGFTLVEVIIVVSILIILTSISIISYDNSLTDARNSGRITDMGNLKVSLKNHKLKQGTYPKPGSVVSVTNNGLEIAKQGYLNADVITQEIINKPVDPLTKTSYMYSITANRLKFQIAMSTEDESVGTDAGMRAFVDGDYQKTTDMLPSIVFANNAGGDIATINKDTILDKGTLNLPYDTEGNIVTTATDIAQVTGEPGVNIPNYYGYYSCVEVYENGAYVGTGAYSMLDSNGDVVTNTCDSTNIVLVLN